MEPFFNPPLHKQRHQFVIDFIKKNKTKKVVDLGCSECSLLKKLKFHREIEHLVGVDINGAVIKKKMHSLGPISTDFLQPGYEQLCVEMYQGSVTERDARLRGFHLALSIELIEHLFVPDVQRFTEVLFGFMAPEHAIVSTPNSDFNPLLPGLRGFRHPDHKFEWSRHEFQSWAESVCEQFGYEAEFTGVGRAPDGRHEQFGFCSQIAVFHRVHTADPNIPRENLEETSYTLLYSVKYPSLRDNNVLRRVLVSEVLFWAETMKRSWSQSKEQSGEPHPTKSSAACGDVCPPEDKQRSASDSGAESDECFWPNRRRPYRIRNSASQNVDSVAVPLSLLWLSCPRVSSLSGSLSNLRLFLTDEPQVRLNQDGSALLLEPEESDEDELCDEDLDDNGCPEVEQNQYVCSMPEENWEED